MKHAISVGLLCAMIYVIFVLLFPHTLPRYQGLESDFISTYVDGAMWLESAFEAGKENAVGRWRDGDPFAIHGIGYPLALFMIGNNFDHRLPGMKYFVAGKILSLVSAVAVILLIFVWLGRIPGLITFLILALMPSFFDIAYSVSTDMYALALLVWAFYALWKERWLLGGVLLGLLVITRYEMAVFVPFALLLSGSWKNRGLLALPVVGLLLINFLFVKFPPNSSYGMALHYLNNDQLPDLLPVGWDSKYHNGLEIFFSNPLRNLWWFARDLFVNIGYVGSFAGFWLLIFSIQEIAGWWKKSRALRLVLIALGLHFLSVTLVSYHEQSLRYYWIEMLALAMLGSWGVWKRGFVRWIYIPVAVVIVSVSLIVLPRFIKAQMTYDPNMFASFSRVVHPEHRIMALRGFLSFSVGCEWKYFPVNESDIYALCLRDSVDWVLYGGFEQKLRSEWNWKLGNSKNAAPEFLPAVHVPGFSTLYYVNKADSVREKHRAKEYVE